MLQRRHVIHLADAGVALPLQVRGRVVGEQAGVKPRVGLFDDGPACWLGLSVSVGVCGMEWEGGTDLLYT